MTKVFIFVLSLLMPDGTIKMEVTAAANCPERESFAEYADQLVASGRILQWNAVCITPTEAGQGV